MSLHCSAKVARASPLVTTAPRSGALARDSCHRRIIERRARPHASFSARRGRSPPRCARVVRPPAMAARDSCEGSFSRPCGPTGACPRFAWPWCAAPSRPANSRSPSGLTIGSMTICRTGGRGARRGGKTTLIVPAPTRTTCRGLEGTRSCVPGPSVAGFRRRFGRRLPTTYPGPRGVMEGFSDRSDSVPVEFRFGPPSVLGGFPVRFRWRQPAAQLLMSFVATRASNGRRLGHPVPPSAVDQVQSSARLVDGCRP